MFRITLIILLSLASAMFARAAACADSVGPPAAHGSANTDPGHVYVPEWEFSLTTGYGTLENPIAGKRDGETYFLPSFSYYGKRFFFSNLTAGYTLVENRHFYFDLVARPNEDGLYYALDNSAHTAGILTNHLSQAQTPDPADLERRVSLVAGPSATLVSEWVDVSFSWFHDISGVHNGAETHLSFDKQYPLLGGAVAFGLGAIHKDADLVGYYYQFTEREADFFYTRYATRYPVGDATDQYARLQFSYPLGRQLELRMAARYNHYDLDGRNPRIIDNPETLNWFAGLQYTFGGAL